jgi:hypothetical protein
MDIILNVSNFHHRKGGAYEMLKLGGIQDLQRIREKSIVLSLFVCGSILMIGIYHFVLYFLRRRDRAPLYFGIFCFIISAYGLVSGERYLVELLPGMGWEFIVKTANLTSFLSLPISLMFLRSLFPQDIKKPLHDILITIFILLAGTVLLTPARVYSYVIPVFHITAIIGALYAIYVLMLGFFKEREGAGILLVGTCILVSMAVNDILYDNQVIKTGQLIHLGMFIFILSQSILLSMRFSKAVSIVEKQPRELSGANDPRTGEIITRRKTEVALKESEEKYRLQLKMQGRPYLFYRTTRLNSTTRG